MKNNLKTAEIWLNRYRALLNYIYDPTNPIERRERAVRINVELVNRLRRVAYLYHRPKVTMNRKGELKKYEPPHLKKQSRYTAYVGVNPDHGAGAG